MSPTFAVTDNGIAADVRLIGYAFTVAPFSNILPDPILNTPAVYTTGIATAYDTFDVTVALAPVLGCVIKSPTFGLITVPKIVKVPTKLLPPRFNVPVVGLVLVTVALAPLIVCEI